MIISDNQNFTFKLFYITLNSCICIFGESNEKVVTNINLIQKISGPLYTLLFPLPATSPDTNGHQSTTRTYKSGFRELFAREGELNRSQARERVAQKEIAQLKADLDYERTNNGRTKLDLEKQALKKACKHHKTKAETLAIQLDESKLGKCIKWYASSRWLFGPNSTWGSIEAMTIVTTHPTLYS